MSEVLYLRQTFTDCLINTLSTYIDMPGVTVIYGMLSAVDTFANEFSNIKTIVF